MDYVESLKRVCHRVGLVERERVARLGADVHPYDLESGPVVAHGRAPGTAEKIKQTRFHVQLRLP